MLTLNILSYNVGQKSQSRDVQSLIQRIVHKRPAIVCLHNVNQQVLDQIRDSPVLDTYFVPKRPDLNPVGKLILARHKLAEIHTNRFSRPRSQATHHQRGATDVDRAANMTTGVVYVPMGDNYSKPEAVFVSAVTLSASNVAWRERQNQWRDILQALDPEPRVLISVCSNCSQRGNDTLNIPDDYMLAEDKANRDVQVLFRTENEAEFRKVSYFETSEHHTGLELELLNDTTRVYVERVASDDYTPSPLSSPSPPPSRSPGSLDTPPQRRHSRLGYRAPQGLNRPRRHYSSEDEEYGLYSDDNSEHEDDKTSHRLRAIGQEHARGQSLRVHDEQDTHTPTHRERVPLRDQRSHWDKGRRGFSFERPRDRRRTLRDVMREEEIQRALDKRAQIDRFLRRDFSRERAEEARKLDSRTLSRRVFRKRHDEVGSRRDMRPIDEVRKLTESERRAVDNEWKRRYGKSRKDIERIQRMDGRALAQKVIFRGDKNDDADERKYARRSIDEDMARLEAERRKQEQEFTRKLDEYYGENRPRPRMHSSRQRAPGQRARFD